MENYSLFDYIKWRGDLSFKVKSFNYIDALNLTMVAFIDFSKYMSRFPSKDKIVVKKMYQTYMKNHDIKKMSLGLLLPNDIFELGKLMDSSYRYEKIEASNYIDSIDVKVTKQFSAMTYHLDKDTIYVAFRGTDDTLIGWAENVNMLSTYPIPAQSDACKYLNDVAKLFPDTKIYVGGHSKGGNLAVYSAVYCDDAVQERIKEVYSFDGPGFYKDNLDQERFNKIKSRIMHILPNSSIIGRIFHLDVKPTIVYSFSKGLDQHNPLTWRVQRDHFERSKSFDKRSNNIKKSIDGLIESLSEEDKRDFAQDLTKFVDNLKLNHLNEFLNPSTLFSLISSTYWLKHKNFRLLLKLYIILYRNGAILVKIQK